MTAGKAFIILAIERLAAHLFTRRTFSSAAFLIAGMLSAVSNSFTFDITGKLSGTLNLLLLGSTLAGLYHHLQARGTISTVTSFSAIMATTSEDFATRVPTGWGRLDAGQHVVGLPARAVTNQGERT